MLGNVGFAFPEVQSIPIIDDVTQIVDIEFRMDPGQKSTVRRINITGNDNTNDEVYRRELRQFEASIHNNSNIERSIRIALSKDADEHNKHLFFLANVGSVSPYIGLFGTVIGIVNAFFGLSDASQATINAVAPGISEALIATALGLFAAIPAVIAFNRFTAFSNDLIRFDSIFGEQLISRFTHLDTK